MALQIKVATKYEVNLTPIFLDDFEDILYVYKIHRFVEFVKRQFTSYWQPSDYDDIPTAIEIDKAEVEEYLKDKNAKYRDTFESLLELADYNNDFIHIELK